MNTRLLSLVSQLAVTSERPGVVKSLAAELQADDLLVFVQDSELGILLPAPGFQQTLPKAHEWTTFLASCTGSGTYATQLPHPTTTGTIQATALVYKNELAVVLIDHASTKQTLDLLTQLLPLLASLFYCEQFIDQTKVSIQQAETTATEHKNIAYKLDMTRKSLQSALSEKESEIQERSKSEHALTESEQRFRFMAESLPTMVFTTQPDGRQLDYVSPKWTLFTGVPVETIVQNGLASMVHPDDAGAVIKYWLRAFHTGDPIEQEVRMRRADGVYHWHLSRAEAMRDEQGKITMWVGSATDIDDVKKSMQKKLELEKKTVLLTRQQENLLELNAAKDEFIRLASHQLRTPATSVKMYIGMLMGGYADPPTDSQMRMLDQAYESNDRQLQIIDDLLKVATVDAGKVLLSTESCDLAKLVGTIVDELRHTLASRQQEFVFVPPKKPIIAEVDTRFIRMVIENLIDNASKYSADYTTITINMKRSEYTEITIADHGVGIAKKDQALLFRKFSRVHNDRSVTAAGTGLGLYWAKKIITLHGGTIGVRSKLHHGSTFSIKLP